MNDLEIKCQQLSAPYKDGWDNPEAMSANYDQSSTMYNCCEEDCGGVNSSSNTDCTGNCADCTNCCGDDTSETAPSSDESNTDADISNEPSETSLMHSIVEETTAFEEIFQPGNSEDYYYKKTCTTTMRKEQTYK